VANHALAFPGLFYIVVHRDADEASIRLLREHSSVFFICAAEVKPEHLATITAAAASRLRLARLTAVTSLGQIQLTRLARFSAGLCLETDPSCATSALVQFCEDWIGVKAARYFAYDLRASVLRSFASRGQQECMLRASSGLLAFVARTAEGASSNHVEMDPRYDRRAEGSDVHPGRVLIEPVRGISGVVTGVILAWRPAEDAPFVESDATKLRLLADCCAPALNNLTRAQSEEPQSFGQCPRVSASIFRKEAFDYSSGTRIETGKPLPATAVWLRWAHWITITLFLGVFAGVGAIRVDDTATAPGVVRRVSGAAAVIHPSEKTDGSSPSATRVASSIANFEVVAHFSATYASHLRRQMPIVLTIAGDPKKRDTTYIDEISVSAQESSADAGNELPGTLVVIGPVAEHSVSGDSGSQLSYHEGMRVQATVRIGSERLLLKLLPSVRSLFRF